MSNSEAKFHLSISEGILQISGSELFVTQQIENFKDVILESLDTSSKPVQLLPANNMNDDQNASDEADHTPNTEPETKKSNIDYSNVLHIEGDDVNIITNIPGKTKGEKTRNVALVYLWGLNQVGINTVSQKEIRELCKEQSCLDDSNFAAHLKVAKQHILLEGKSGSNKTCKLTFPGKELASSLVKQINEG